jgi:hypothetical protein
MSDSPKRRRGLSLLARALFLDLLANPQARPIFIYVATFVTLSAAIFHWLEGWNWLDSFYFVVITFTTIGYGDFTPTLPITKLISIFIGLNGVVVLLSLFDAIRRVRSWDGTEESNQKPETSQG